MVIALLASLILGLAVTIASLQIYPQFIGYIHGQTETRLRELLPMIESEAGQKEIRQLAAWSPWLSLGVLLLLLLFARSLLAVLLAFVAAYYAYKCPYIWQARLRRTQDAKLLEQLPDALNAVANSLKSGESLPMAFKVVGGKYDNPIGAVFRSIASLHGAGQKFEDALMNVFGALNIEAFDFSARAICIHVKRGGPAFEMLNEIRSTIIEQDRCDRVIKATTASGRFTMKFLKWSPVFIIPMLLFLQPDFASILLGNPFGVVLTVVAVSIYLFAKRWASHILSIEKI